MKQLAWVQIATWLGLFCVWLYFPVAVAHNVFGASDPHSALYTEGVAWGGYCFAMYSAVCFAWSFVMPALANKLGRKATHSFCLLCGAVGLMSVAVIHNKWLLLASMVGVGIAWASTLAMPYAILSGSLPACGVDQHHAIVTPVPGAGIPPPSAGPPKVLHPVSLCCQTRP